MIAKPQAIINLSALRHNVEVVKRASPIAKILAVIKADAYGHGLAAVAATLGQQQLTDGFAVARLSEALVLRGQGFKQKVVVLTGFLTPEDLELAVENKIDIVLHNESQLELLETVRLENSIGIWLKINTGMNRLGIEVSQFGGFINRLEQLEKIRKPVNLMTHLACADEFGEQKTKTKKQIETFDEAVNATQGEQSIANSAGLLAWPNAQRHWVRPGIMLYGASPFTDVTADKYDLKPVMTLKSFVLNIRDVKKGGRVGYGGSWLAKKTTRIATIGIGYGDGYPRHANEGTPVLIGTQQAKLVGRVSMDSITVDISQCENIAIADEVVLWGEGLPVDIIAQHSGTISYELFCGVSARVPRIYQD